MAWQPVATEPLDIDTGVAPARARAIATALLRHAVPLLACRQGRAEPLASAALFRVGGRVVLVTCRHIFDDGFALGDLGVPLVHGVGVLWLRRALMRVIAHPQRDLALIDLAPGRTRDELLRHWPAVPVSESALQATQRPALYVLAGWPYAQMRRIDHTVYARPIVFFAAPADRPDGAEQDAEPTCRPSLPASVRVRYARVARRSDGLDVHAPELDGVSGATLWAVIEDGCAAGDCVLQPAAVQCAFKHDAYARAEPLTVASGLFERVLRG